MNGPTKEYLGTHPHGSYIQINFGRGQGIMESNNPKRTCIIGRILVVYILQRVVT